MKRVNVILAMLVVVFGVTTLSAQHGQRGHRLSHEKVFYQLDKNDDGKISKAEAEQAPRKRLSENFDKLDANTDGYIEKSEFKKMREHRKEKMMKRADTNKDGKVSIDEMLALKKQHLMKADKNNNGFLEQEELAEMRQHRKGQHCKGKGKRKGEKHCKKSCDK